jgi:hypothetical protein
MHTGKRFTNKMSKKKAWKQGSSYKTHLCLHSQVKENTYSTYLCLSGVCKYWKIFLSLWGRWGLSQCHLGEEKKRGRDKEKKSKMRNKKQKKQCERRN